MRARKMLPVAWARSARFEAIPHPLSARIPHKHAASASMQSHSAVLGVHAALLANCCAAHPTATFALPPAPPAAAQVISRPQEKKSSPEKALEEGDLCAEVAPVCVPSPLPARTPYASSGLCV